MAPILTGINWSQLILKILLTSAVLFVAFGTCVLIIVVVHKLSKMDFSRKNRIKLTNNGNVASYYQLQVTASEPRLQFKLLMDGIPLADIPDEQIEVLAPRQQGNVTVPVSQPGPEKIVQKGKEPVKKGNSAVKGASEAGNSIAEKSGAIASLLGTIGSMLPGSAGAALKEQGEAARNVQTKTSQTMQMPETAKNKMDALHKDSGKLGVATPEAPTQTTGNKKSSTDQTNPVQVPQQKMAMMDTGRTVRGKTKRRGCFVQTKKVSSGESLELILSITPIGRFSPAGSFVYSVISQQIPLEKLDQDAPKVNSQGVVYFKDIAAWRYWLPPILNGMIVFMELLGLVYFVTLIWL